MNSPNKPTKVAHSEGEFEDDETNADAPEDFSSSFSQDYSANDDALEELSSSDAHEDKIPEKLSSPGSEDSPTDGERLSPPLSQEVGAAKALSPSNLQPFFGDDLYDELPTQEFFRRATRPASPEVKPSPQKDRAAPRAAAKENQKITPRPINTLKKAPNGTKEKPQLAFRLPYDESDYDSEDDDENRIGNVPLWWYDDQDHIGYSQEGKKILKSLESTEIENLLKEADDPSHWRTIFDPKNNKTIRLTDSDILAIKRIREGHYPVASIHTDDIDDDYIEYDNPDKIFPARNTPEPKSRFLPSKWEAKEVTRLVKLIRSGKLKLTKAPQKQPIDNVYDIWGTNLTEADLDNQIKTKGPPKLPAPKLALPGHAESYHPPEEYLFNDEELKAWDEADPEDRPMNFIPHSFSSLRKVPSYKNGILERFERCLDLYLCPRAVKMRMNVDPKSLLPDLPSPSSLKPFPSRIAFNFATTHTHTEEQALYRSISIDADCHWVAVGGNSNTLKIFDFFTSRCQLEWKLSSNISCVCWHPSLPILAIAVVEDLYILHIDLPNHKETYEPLPKSNSMPFNAFTEACNTFETLFEQDLEKSGWRNLAHSKLTQNEKVLKSKGVLSGVHIKHDTIITQIIWHSKGKYLAVTCPNSTSPSQQCAIHSLTKAKSVHPIRSASSGKAQFVQFHPTKPIFLAGYTRGIKMYDLQSKPSTDTTKTRCPVVRKLVGVEDITSFDMHHSGEHIIVGGSNRRLTWYDLDLKNDKPYKIFRFHERAINSVAFHKKYPLMFSTSNDGFVHIYHAKIFDDLLQNPLIIPIKKLKNPNSTINTPVMASVWHPDQPWLISAHSDGNISLWV